MFINFTITFRARLTKGNEEQVLTLSKQTNKTENNEVY